MCNVKFQKVNCASCKRVIGEAEPPTTVRLKCPKCGTWNIVTLNHDKPEPRNFSERMENITLKRASA